MAQIIKHRRGSLENLSQVTSSIQKGELVIASGSSNLSVTNGSSIVFAAAADGQLQAVNRIMVGTAAPASFPNATYNGLVAGVPYYESTSGSLWILGTDSNTKLNLIGNINSFSQSVDSRLDSVEASLGGGGDIGSSVTFLNQFTASATIRLNNLESTSASVNGHIADINSYTSSANTLNSLQTTRIDQLAAATSSVNNFTSSATNRLNNLESTSASVNGHIVDINSYTSSLKAALTASGANVIFSGNVTIPGNLTVAGTQTIVNSTTVQIGDNIIELNGSGAANGGIMVKDATNPNTATGSLLWDTTNDYWKAGISGSEVKILRAGGDDVVSGSSQITISSTTGYSAFSSSISTNIVELFGTASNHEGRLDTIEASIAGGAVSTRIDQLAAATASVNSFTQSTLGHIADINSYTASNDTLNTLQSTRINQLAALTASVSSRLDQLSTDSGSQNTRITTLESKATTLQTYTASVDGHIADINAYTSSNNTTNTAQNNRLSNIEAFTSSFGTSFSTSVDSRLDTLEGTGTIQGVGTGNQVTFAKVTTSGDVVVGGDLVVQGNTVTLNTATLVVEDKTIQLASGSTNAAAANGAGIEVMGASATFTYDSTPNAWTANIPISASAVTASVNVPGFGSSKRLAFRAATGNLDFIAAATTTGDIAQWDGTNFVMSNVIDGGTF